MKNYLRRRYIHKNENIKIWNSWQIRWAYPFMIYSATLFWNRQSRKWLSNKKTGMIERLNVNLCQRILRVNQSVINIPTTSTNTGQSAQDFTYKQMRCDIGHTHTLAILTDCLTFLVARTDYCQIPFWWAPLGFLRGLLVLAIWQQVPHNYFKRTWEFIPFSISFPLLLVFLLS